ncbi:MAG: bifunctional adenosylcobinamide kinase/adenosylcobinamide-phosphate guanylyltransferase [Chloroflexi bacterium]|nr:bifunctional adenosylcobinamide kinase/adenosylcobinamide-phosphate guanylyltransferase [Chloroflexota bacterium]
MLVIGGARSGKSRYAEELACRRPGPVLYVATATASDDEMARRIREHRAYRSSEWRTIEAPTAVANAIEGALGDSRLILLDCLGVLVNNLIIAVAGTDPDAPAHVEEEPMEAQIRAEVDSLISCVNRTDASFIIVSNEVGAGLVPPYQLGRLFRDLMGFANQALAQHADQVYYMVAGLPLRLKPAP